MVAARPSLDILLVEDQASIRALVTGFLSGEGHRVRIAEPHTPLPHAQILLADWLVPGFDMRAAIAQFLDSSPGSRCVIMSGLDVPLDVFAPELRQRISYLPKPFSPAMLLRALLGDAAG